MTKQPTPITTGSVTHTVLCVQTQRRDDSNNTNRGDPALRRHRANVQGRLWLSGPGVLLLSSGRGCCSASPPPTPPLAARSLDFCPTFTAALLGSLTITFDLQALIFLSAPCLGLNSFLGGCRHPVLTLDTLRSASRLLGSGPARVQEYRPPTHILEPQVSSEPGCTQGRRKLTQPPSKVLGLVMVTCHNFETHL